MNLSDVTLDVFTVCHIPVTVYPVSEHIGLPQSKAKLSKNGHYSDIIVKYSMWYYCKMTVHNIVEEKNDIFLPMLNVT